MTNVESEDVWNNVQYNVYDLMTELCRHILKSNSSIQKNSYFVNEYEDTKTIRHLRAKAYGILLNKVEGPNLTQERTKIKETDPVSEILKHAFVLKLCLRRAYDAKALECLLEELETDLVIETQIYSVLQFLIQLKSFDSNPEPITNIFYYGKANPNIPEISYSTKKVPLFQTYPMECFVLSDKFEATLHAQRHRGIKNTPMYSTNEVCFHGDRFKSKNLAIDTGCVSTTTGPISNHAIDEGQSYLPVSVYRYFSRDFSFVPNSLHEIMIKDGNESEQVFSSDLRLVTTHLYSEFNRSDTESVFGTWKSSIHSLFEESDLTTDNLDQIWEQVDIHDRSITNERTWECFGGVRSTKELPFMSDLSNTAVYLAKINQISFLSLLSQKLLNSVFLLEELPANEFIKDVKTMLLGVESYSFGYENTVGFTLRKDFSVHGVCAESLKMVCQEAITWGNCFMFLSKLITPDLVSGKLLQEGLIFKAMCTNIKELLLYYRAALSRIYSLGDQSGGLLQLLQKVRPVATLISAVARLCEPYKENHCIVGEGNAILTRIYKEVIKVTDSKIALIFYSILKSCCEVYFRFLQKWIFEGMCDDIYGEFMIKTSPQYLRNRGRKFWTKSFSVCNEDVPGFLNDLSESILQCGKTVKLLRICDSKNPVCSVCVTEHPEVKVCLSVSMLREQLSRCQLYEGRGKEALGPILSLSLAIQNRKKAEKGTVTVKRDTVAKIDEEREDRLRKIAQAKRDLLKELKEQVTISDLQKRKEKEDQLRMDKILLEKIDREQIKLLESRAIERSNILSYYEDLADDIEKRRARSQWRMKRMSFYEKRVAALAAMKRDSFNTVEEDNSVTKVDAPIDALISFEDENKNVSRTTEVIVPIVTIQKEAEENPLCTNYAYRRNNERSAFQEFLNEEKLKELKARSLKGEDTRAIDVANSNRADETENVLKSSCVDTVSTIERPTFLSFSKVNGKTESREGETNVDVRKYDMTPNNNELDVDVIDDGRKSAQNAKYSTDLNRGNDLETPMSCTTDNFTSSMQSPLSQTQNSEAVSPVEASSEDVSSCSRMARSLVAAKEESTFPGLFGLDRDYPMVSPSEAVPLTVADVEVIDHTSLQVYLEKSIFLPLKIQSRLVNNAIIKYFLEEHDLLLHLHNLRSYYFLLNGEFAKSLTDSLYSRFYEISVPIELFNSASLTSLLERALVNSFSSTYIKSKLLSLSAIDNPSQLHISDPSALDCLTLNYKISWPLNIILDNTVMLQYGKVFKFLITSGRVSWILQEDFNILKRERLAARSEQYHKLQLYRHSMTQFMNAFHNYLTCSVLHASWTEFEKDLENSLTVDQIYFSHVNYIKRILSRCMLNTRGERMRTCLNSVFKVILKFHNRLRSQSWHVKSTEYVHPNFKKLQEMYQTFCELRAYMAHLAHKLAISGYQPHLMHFLNALNINHVYDITVKSRQSSAGATEL